MSIQRTNQSQYHPCNPIGIVKNHPYATAALTVGVVALAVAYYMHSSSGLLHSCQNTFVDSSMKKFYGEGFIFTTEIVQDEDALHFKAFDDSATILGIGKAVPLHNLTNKYYLIYQTAVQGMCKLAYQDPPNDIYYFDTDRFPSFKATSPSQLEEACSPIFENLAEYLEKLHPTLLT